MLADVVLPSRRFQVFTYSIPHLLRDQVFVGSQVLIPLGSSVVTGVVVRILENSALPSVRSSNPTIAFRDILSVEATPEHSSLDQKSLRLVEHIADYYLAPFSACLRLIVPPRLINVTKRLVLTEAGREALANPSLLMEERVTLQKLSRGSKGILPSSLLRTLPKATTLVSKLRKKGWVEERSVLPSTRTAKIPGATSSGHGSVHPSSFGAMGDLFEQRATKSSSLASRQSDMSEKMKALAQKILNESPPGAFQKDIVIGTNPERLQVFQQIALTILQQDRRVLFLVPEVYDAEIVFTQLKGILSESVAVYHGKLSTSVRADCWERIRQGRVQVVVGTRSALFVPLPDLGLIWLDQEEDASYKDEHLPYYHAREVASMRGAIEEALVLYGSSCPSLEIYSGFRDKVRKTFPGSRPRNPEINLIDMRDLASSTLLSPTLAGQLAAVLNEGQQAILILNRKGFSQSLICADCGKAPACETCGVTLRFFQRPSRLMCSYCRRNFPIPETCSSCLGTVFRFSGVGTQRLEEELTKLFPSHVLFRFDRDQVKTAKEGIQVLNKFRQRDIHILIGTEFLLHQPVLPTAKLVAFPQADLGLHLPNFRSAERTFLSFSSSHAVS